MQKQFEGRNGFLFGLSKILRQLAGIFLKRGEKELKMMQKASMNLVGGGNI